MADAPESEKTLPIIEPQRPEQESPSKSVSRTKSALRYLQAEISIKHADIPIIACCFVSGLCDSSAYNAWTCFVSMQTGNTIFLALGASGQPHDHPYGWLKSITSIISFICGCFFFSNTRFIKPKARGTLGTSFFLQSCCVIIAAAVVQAHIVPEPSGEAILGLNFKELIPLGFLAFQSGGQMTTSRLLGFNEIPTTVLTSVYCDLSSDPRILRKDNVKRNRRAGAVLCILTGGIVGGWVSRSSAGMSTSLWIAAAVKMAIALSWSLWTPAPPLQI